MSSTRIATFNVENLDTKSSEDDDTVPSISRRIDVLKPQLERIDADILCLQEVHAQKSDGGDAHTLSALDNLIADTQYADYERATTTTENGEPFAKRNLVVLSRFPISATNQFNQDLVPGPAYRPVTAEPRPDTASTVTWERPILKVAVEVADGRSLHVLNVHLKSKLPTEITGQTPSDAFYQWNSFSGWAEGYFLSTIKRVGQALELRTLIDMLFTEHDDPLIAACGDYNAEFESVPLKTVCGPRAEVDNPDLSEKVMVPCGQSIPKSARYTLLHLGEGEMIDHILMSRPLLEYYNDATIHNELLADESGPYRYDTYFPESDHAPLIAEFDLPNA